MRSRQAANNHSVGPKFLKTQKFYSNYKPTKEQASRVPAYRQPEAASPQPKFVKRESIRR